MPGWLLQNRMNPIGEHFTVNGSGIGFNRFPFINSQAFLMPGFGLPLLLAFSTISSHAADSVDQTIRPLMRTYKIPGMVVAVTLNKSVLDSAQRYGMYPVVWDTPESLFDWSTGAVKDRSTIRALTGGPALPPTGS